MQGKIQNNKSKKEGKVEVKAFANESNNNDLSCDYLLDFKLKPSQNKTDILTKSAVCSNNYSIAENVEQGQNMINITIQKKKKKKPPLASNKPSEVS